MIETLAENPSGQPIVALDNIYNWFRVSILKKNGDILPWSVSTYA